MTRTELAMNRVKRHYPVCENIMQGYDDRFFDDSKLDYPEELEDPDEL